MLYQQNLEYVLAVTKMLNETELPEDGSSYIHVELREMDTHVKLGEWSDEIASDAWAFDSDIKE